ncbi:MAG: polysaccharide deacetylase family protein [Chloroflexota bacterium]
MKNFFGWLCVLWLLAACAPAAASQESAPASTAGPTSTPELEAADPPVDLTPPPASPLVTPVPTDKPEFSPRRIPTTTATRIAPTPFPSPTRPAAHETRVPVLMYHHIAVPPPIRDAIRFDLSVWPENFEQQLAYFETQGFHSVKLEDVYDAVTKNAPLPSKPIVFTFDDGYDDNYANAMPILQKHKFIGTFYIPTGLLERPGYMTWAQVVELSKAGMDVESHSVSHPSLKAKPLEFLRKELGDSKRALEMMLGKPVLFFCYPSGQYDALTIQVLQELGYLSATTTYSGAWQNAAMPYEWPRVRIHGGDTLNQVAGRVRDMVGR